MCFITQPVLLRRNSLDSTMEFSYNNDVIYARNWTGEPQTAVTVINGMGHSVCSGAQILPLFAWHGMCQVFFMKVAWVCC